MGAFLNILRPINKEIIMGTKLSTTFVIELLEHFLIEIWESKTATTWVGDNPSSVMENFGSGLDSKNLCSLCHEKFR